MKIAIEYVERFIGNKPEYVGALGYKLDGRMISHNIIALDDADRQYLQNIGVRPGSVIFRCQSDMAAESRLSYFVLVDLDRMMIYFNESFASDQDRILWETAGTKLNFMTLELGADAGYIG